MEMKRTPGLSIPTALASLSRAVFLFFLPEQFELPGRPNLRPRVPKTVVCKQLPDFDWRIHDYRFSPIVEAGSRKNLC